MGTHTHTGTWAHVHTYTPVHKSPRQSEALPSGSVFILTASAVMRYKQGLGFWGPERECILRIILSQESEATDLGDRPE